MKSSTNLYLKHFSYFFWFSHKMDTNLKFMSENILLHISIAYFAVAVKQID